MLNIFLIGMEIKKIGVTIFHFLKKICIIIKLFFRKYFIFLLHYIIIGKFPLINLYFSKYIMMKLKWLFIKCCETDI